MQPPVPLVAVQPDLMEQSHSLIVVQTNLMSQFLLLGLMIEPTRQSHPLSVMMTEQMQVVIHLHEYKSLRNKQVVEREKAEGGSEKGEKFSHILMSAPYMTTILTKRLVFTKSKQEKVRQGSE